MSFHLDKEALIASGIKDEDRIFQYLDKLEELHEQVHGELVALPDPVSKAKALFEWLWKGKPNRYKRHGSYRLHEVIEAQLSVDREAVGNCLGLTLLNNVLLRKLRIHARAVHLEHAFGIGPHVLTHMRAGTSTIDVENIFPDGFDYKGHLDNPTRVVWGDKELVADVYHSDGNVYFEMREYEEALKLYDLAIKLNPRYEKARLNRMMALSQMGIEKDEEGGAR